MIINKTKNYNSISIAEIKEDLNISSTDTTYDSQIKRFLKSAISEAEAIIQDDIVPTINTLEETSYICPFTYSCYEIGNVNITVSAVTVTVINGTGSTVTNLVNGTDYYVEKGQNLTTIKFRNWITGNVLNITYTSGFASIPESIKRAISVKCGEYLDVDRNGFYTNNLIRSKAFERLLSNYKTIY